MRRRLDDSRLVLGDDLAVSKKGAKFAKSVKKMY